MHCIKKRACRLISRTVPHRRPCDALIGQLKFQTKRRLILSTREYQQTPKRCKHSQFMKNQDHISGKLFKRLLHIMPIVQRSTIHISFMRKPPHISGMISQSPPQSVHPLEKAPTSQHDQQHCQPCWNRQPTGHTVIGSGMGSLQQTDDKIRRSMQLLVLCEDCDRPRHRARNSCYTPCSKQGQQLWECRSPIPKLYPVIGQLQTEIRPIASPWSGVWNFPYHPPQCSTHSRLQLFAQGPHRESPKAMSKLSDTLIESHLGQRRYQSRKNYHI